MSTHSYTFKFSKDLSTSFIKDVNLLDHKVYQEQLTGSVESITQRFNKNKESYFLCYEGPKLVGYICFFPISQKLRDQIIQGEFKDDNITPDDVLKYKKNLPLSILTISIAVDPTYQNQTIGTKLLSKMFEFIENKNNQGFNVNEIIAETVSVVGSTLYRSFNFEIVKDSMTHTVWVHHFNKQNKA